MLFNTLCIVTAYLDLDTCTRIIDCTKDINQDELWRVKFNYTYPSYINKQLPLSHYELLHLPRLFCSEQEIPILAHYLVHELVVDILGDAYYINDGMYPLLTTSVLTTCVYFEHESYIGEDLLHLLYINIQDELRSLTIDGIEHTDILLQEDVRCASYDGSDLVVLRSDGAIDVFSIDYEWDPECHLTRYELLVIAIQQRTKPWINLTRREDAASIIIYDHTLIIVTEEGGQYVIHFNHEWGLKYDNDLCCTTFREKNEWYAFRYDKYVLTVNDTRTRVIYPYHVYPLCEKSFEFEKVEYVQGLPMITYRGKIYSPIDFVKLCIGLPIRYHLQEMKNTSTK